MSLARYLDCKTESLMARRKREEEANVHARKLRKMELEIKDLEVQKARLAVKNLEARGAVRKVKSLLELVIAKRPPTATTLLLPEEVQERMWTVVNNGRKVAWPEIGIRNKKDRLLCFSPKCTTPEARSALLERLAAALWPEAEN